MVSKYILLLFIPALVSARIGIKITAGRSESDAQIEYTGADSEIISDKERETFQIGDKDLKAAVKKLTGAYPTDVFVRSPTPWNDVYKTNDWDQVMRTLKPVRSRILGIHTKPIIISTREFDNYSQVKAKYNAAIAHSVQETVTTSYSTGGQLTVGQELTFNVNYAAGSVGGSASLSFTASWGNETNNAKSVTLGTSSGVEVELLPGQSVIASLTATRGTLDLEIDYEARLTGLVFANYIRKYEGHHFWAVPIEKVLKVARLPQYIKSTQKISIGFYASAKLVVKDRKTTGTMKFVPAGIIKGPGTGTIPNMNYGGDLRS